MPGRGLLPAQQLPGSGGGGAQHRAADGPLASWARRLGVRARCNKSLLSIASVVLSDNVHKIGPRNQIALRLSVFLLLLSSLVVKVRGI